MKLFANIKEKGISSVRRFPISIVLSILGAIFLCVENHYKFELGSENFVFFVLAYLSGGVILSIATILYIEDFSSKKNTINILVQAIWAVVVGILAMFFTNNELYVTMAIFSIISLIVVITPAIPFVKEKNDLAFWNFSIKTILGLLRSFVLSLVLIAGAFLLILSLDKLFGVKITDQIYFDAFVAMCFLSLMVFLQTIPVGKDKFIREPIFPGRGFTKVIHFLLIPLLVAYIAILFIYGASIIINWNLPNGWVSVPVIVSFVSMFIVLFLEFPIKFRQENAFDKKIMKILPAAVLPLLILMSVAIGRRVLDYGITVQRLYAILFNMWSYAVCLGLIFFSKKRIWWAFASFATIFFIVSAGPINVCSITRNKLLKEINIVCSNEELVLNRDFVNQAASKYIYLKRCFGEEKTDEFISEDFRSILNTKSDRVECKSLNIRNSYVDVPQGAKQAIAFHLNVSNINPEAEFSDAFIKYTIFDDFISEDMTTQADTVAQTGVTSPTEVNKRVKCRVPVRQLIELSKKESVAPVRIECEGGVAYITEYCSLYFEPVKETLEIDLTGLLFLN